MRRLTAVLEVGPAAALLVSTDTALAASVDAGDLCQCGQCESGALSPHFTHDSAACEDLCDADRDTPAQDRSNVRSPWVQLLIQLY